MLNQDMLEHVTTDGINDGTLPSLIYDVDHTSLLLISFSTFIVQAMEIQCHAGRN
jgi:hypothetical protein